MLPHLPDQYTALVVGAGGIGRAVAQQLADDERLGRLIVVTRDVARLTDQTLPENAPRPEIVQADVTTERGIKRLVKHLDGEALHLLFNTVGVLHDAESGEQPSNVAPEKRLESLSYDNLAHLFHVNAATAAMLLSRLVDNLTQAPAIIASLSARVGSIGDNAMGGWYAYRASKAAHNMLIKTAAVEFKRRNPQAILLCLHPGTTDTTLSKPFQARVPQGKLFTPEFVAERLIDVIGKRSPEESGSFWDWNDQPIEW
ncbi:SDR family NAD(P)-dependent oxidoreductase [Kushneria aurantia]|uniref:SDR family NAD(P)-dependent oxidoreductase n=1 Tax=Kushneria aurantia TaxID=504092 RepID=A0ABV6G2Y7_9GAMM|nr:SDR family NAD(P)-dependent oxidoreductase [Kushneria aurantia]